MREHQRGRRGHADQPAGDRRCSRRRARRCPKSDLLRQIELYLALLRSFPYSARVTVTDADAGRDRRVRRGDEDHLAREAPARRRRADERRERGARHLLPQQRAAPVRDAVALACAFVSNADAAHRGHPAAGVAHLSVHRVRAVPALERGRAAAVWSTACSRRSRSTACIEADRRARRSGAGRRRIRAQAVQLSLLAQATIQTIERYYLAVALLLKAGSGEITQSALEQRCQLMAQRMTMLYGFNSPEFFDRTLFENFIDLLRARGVIRVSGERQARIRRGAGARRRRRAARAERADPPQHPAGHAQLASTRASAESLHTRGLYSAALCVRRGSKRGPA